jgi:CelD/BcsL family acetyltransferase involved in cellulose biosynthesis
MDGRLLDELGAVEPHVRAWDDLAVAGGLPYCTPAWMLGWWKHARPDGARLRVAVALDGAELAGVAPCYAVHQHGVEHVRLLASPISHRTQPLAAAGREREVAEAIAPALADADPGIVALDGVPGASPWPDLLTAAWPGRRRPGRRVGETMGAPIVTLTGRDFDEWFAGRSSNFRSQMRRARRSLEEQGATVRLASTPAEIAQDIDAFIKLHHARWDPRGGSDAVDEGVERMLHEIAQPLVEKGTLRLAAVATADRTVAVQVIVAAGGEASYWLGGFDDEWARSKPALVALLTAVEDAFGRSEDRFDLGGGTQDYKLRFADGQDELEWMSVVPRGSRAALDWARLAPSRARGALARATDEPRAALRRRLRRGGQGGA